MSFDKCSEAEKKCISRSKMKLCDALHMVFNYIMCYLNKLLKTHLNSRQESETKEICAD